MIQRFKDRSDAGRQLAAIVRGLRGEDTIVLALPPGGVPVAYELALALDAPLDVLNVRRLGVPWREDVTMGLIASGGIRILRNDVILGMDVSKESLDEVTRFQRLELERRERMFRAGRPAPVLADRTVVLVDDGIASGESARNAIAVVRSQHPNRIVLAVPVVQDSVAGDLRREVDDLACVRRPTDLFAIRAWYDHFPEVSDWEVNRIVERAIMERGPASHGTARADYGIQ